MSKPLQRPVQVLLGQHKPTTVALEQNPHAAFVKPFAQTVEKIGPQHRTERAYEGDPNHVKGPIEGQAARQG